MAVTRIDTNVDANSFPRRNPSAFPGRAPSDDGPASNLFKDIAFSVSQLTTAIDSGALSLPDVERPFVWPQTEVRDLLDSMYRGFAVGQVMS